MKIALTGHFQTDPVQCGDRTEGDRQRGFGRQGLVIGRGPRAGSRDEGSAQRQRLGMAFARTGQRCGKGGRRGKTLRLTGCTMSLGQKHGVIPQKPVAKRDGKPFGKIIRIYQQPVMRRAFKPAGIGKTTQRKGRRQPGQQP